MKNSSESEQWILDQARANMFAGTSFNLAESAESRRFTSGLWPFLETYSSPLCPVFSFEIGALELQSQNKMWMFRDGVIPLAWFFEGVSDELALSHRLLVHASLSPLVPKVWRRNTKYYDLYSNQCFDKKNRPERLLFVGPVNHDILNIDELNLLLDHTLEAIGTSKIKEVLMYSPVRKSIYFHEQDENFELQYYHQIFSRFGKKMRFINWASLSNSTFAKTAIVDLNAGWIFKDNAVVHQLLSRGAGLLSPNRHGKNGPSTRVQISKFHGVEIMATTCSEIHHVVKNAEQHIAFYSAIHRKLDGARSNDLWPKWFQGFVRSSYKRRV